MRNAILLSAAAALVTFILAGCTTIHRCPQQPALSQEEVDKAIELAKKEVLDDYVAWVTFNDTDAAAKKFRSRMKVLESDYFVDGMDVQVYLTFAEGAKQVGTDELDYDWGFHRAMYAVRRFNGRWRVYSKDAFMHESMRQNPFFTDEMHSRGLSSR